MNQFNHIFFYFVLHLTVWIRHQLPRDECVCTSHYVMKFVIIIIIIIYAHKIHHWVYCNLVTYRTVERIC